MTPLYLGWQYATGQPDPGPPPSQPDPHPPPRLSAGWLAAQRREERRIARPARATVLAAAAAALALAGGGAAGVLPGPVAALAAIACLAAAGPSGARAWRGERALRARIEAEHQRIAAFRADAAAQQARQRAEHTRQAAEWRRQQAAFTQQKRWHAVPVPAGLDRLDVAGGTLAGWSAMLTTAGAYHLAAGGEMTVVDLSGGAVGADLARLSAVADGTPPAVWVLPQDLPRLDLAAPLPSAALADVLALAASVAEERPSARDLAIDTAILDRVIDVLDGGAGDGGAGEGGAGEGAPGTVQVRRVTAGLRVLAQVGDPETDLAAGLLTAREAGALSVLFGQRAADRVVLERALGLEAQLRALESLGTQPVRVPRGRLRVVAVDGRASAQSATALGSFVVTALTRLIGQLPAVPGPPSWRHTVFLLGAERLRGDVLDRLTDACEAGRAGLVLAYRSMPPHVRPRIGRGNAATGFMRLGNGEDAKAASEQLGSAHRFVLSQLTETIGASVTDTGGASYTSTVGGSWSAAGSVADTESRSAGTGRSGPAGGAAPLPGGGSRSAQAGTSSGTTTSASLTAGISTSTAWGASTSRATGDSTSLARSLQRSRELLVEPSELQRLPVTAMIVSYGAGPGRRVLLADANPAIGALPVTTLAPLEAPDAPPAADPAARAADGLIVNRPVTGSWPDPARGPWPSG